MMQSHKNPLPNSQMEAKTISRRLFIKVSVVSLVLASAGEEVQASNSELDKENNPKEIQLKAKKSAENSKYPAQRINQGSNNRSLNILNDARKNNECTNGNSGGSCNPGSKGK